MVMFKSDKFYKSLGTALLGVFLFTPVIVSAAETLSPPLTPSKAEIIEKWKQLDQSRYITPTPFQEEPSINYPYKAGVLNQQYIEQGIKTANFYRYMSGLPMNLMAVKELNDLSQYGSVLAANNGYIDHSLPKPDDMPTDFYNNGSFSVASSNLAMVRWNTKINMLSKTVDDYMFDFNNYGVGHRMWILSPYVSSIGFGLARDDQQFGYSAMNIFGYRLPVTSYSPYNYFAFPGNGDYPKEYFNAEYDWSIGIDTKNLMLVDLENLKVALTRKSDHKKWEFSYSNNGNTVGGNFFYVSSGYGKLSTIIFRPNQLDYIQDGEEFTINVSGIKDIYENEYSPINYKTTFFDLIEDRAYGRLVDEETKKPLDAATVDFYQVTSSGNSFYKTITTNSSGEFVYTGLPVGEYKATFTKKGYAGASLGGFQIKNDRDRFDDYAGEFGLNPYPEDIAPPDTPIVHTITDKSTSISGSAEAGSTITVKIGTTILGTKITDVYGDFSLTIPLQKAGTKLIITATDDVGNVSNAKEIFVMDTSKPVISGANSKTITMNSIFNPKTGVTAKDNVDGDLTSVINVSGTVNTKKKGTYTLIYSVMDKSKNVTMVTRKITVIDHIKPVISGAGNKTLKYKSVFSPKAGVTARDNVDGNLTSKIKVTGTVNTKKKGTYTLTYTVMDKSRNVTKVKRKITVKR